MKVNLFIWNAFDEGENHSPFILGIIHSLVL